MIGGSSREREVRARPSVVERGGLREPPDWRARLPPAGGWSADRLAAPSAALRAGRTSAAHRRSRAWSRRLAPSSATLPHRACPASSCRRLRRRGPSSCRRRRGTARRAPGVVAARPLTACATPPAHRRGAGGRCSWLPTSGTATDGARPRRRSQTRRAAGARCPRRTSDRAWAERDGGRAAGVAPAEMVKRLGCPLRR